MNDTVDNLNNVVQEEVIVDIEDALKGLGEDNAVAPSMPEVPEKYQNKSIEDLVEMHKNLESTLGRQSNELGNLRKQNEQLAMTMQTQMTTPSEPTVEDDDDDDWYSNPKKKVEQLLGTKLNALESQLVKDKQERVALQIQTKYPDASAILNDPQFHEYVNANPVHQDLYRKAQNADFASVDYLLSNFKALSKSKENTNVNSAIGETGGAPSANTQPRIRRSQIVELRARDPAKYERLQGQIQEAYRQGRVINE